MAIELPPKDIRNSPTWLDKVNFVKFFTMNGCDTNWWIYLETGGKALEDLAIAFVVPSVGDVVTSFFRPGGLRDARHGRKGRRSGKGEAAIPETGDLVAEKIPFHGDLRRRDVSWLNKHLWLFEGGIEKWLYRMFVVNMVGDFAYDWQSGILNNPGSNCPNIARIKLDATTNFFGPTNQWSAFTIPDLKYINGITDWSHQFVFLPPGKYLCILSSSYKNNGTGLTVTDLALTYEYLGNQYFATAGEVATPPLLTTSNMVSAMVPGPGLLGWRHKTRLQAVDCFDMSLIVQQMGA